MSAGITIATSPLATWGQIAAIILVIELFFFILIALALNLGGMFLFAWIREKAELIKKVRPVVDSVNTTTEAAIEGTLPPPSPEENKVIRTVAQIPAQLQTVDKKVEQGSDRVANAVIEFRARTMMVQGMAKAFFLPGLTRPATRRSLKVTDQPKLLEEPAEVASPALQTDERGGLMLEQTQRNHATTH